MNRRDRRRGKKVAAKNGGKAAPLEDLLERGFAHFKACRLSEATAFYEQALGIDRNHPDALRHLGMIASLQGNSERAFALIRKSLDRDPKSARGHYYLGNAHQNKGEIIEALSCYRNALVLDPDLAEAYNGVGLGFLTLNEPARALKSFLHAASIDPDEGEYWARAVSALGYISADNADEAQLAWLKDLLEKPAVRAAGMMGPIICTLKRHALFSRWLDLTNTDGSLAELIYRDASEELSSIPVFLRLLELTPVNDLKVERMLSVLRRAMIKDAVAGCMSEKGLPFSAALSIYCYTNEYVFDESDEERADVESLRRELEEQLERNMCPSPGLVAAFGAYRPLSCLVSAQILDSNEWLASIEKLVECQIREPREEQALRAKIPQLTPIRGAVSRAVQEQYEENPYPRWVKAGISKQGTSFGVVPLPESPDILVAGCGTGSHALSVASRYLDGNVLAVDLSLSSLAYAARKTKELGFTNIRYAQADILELGGIEERFDLIECGGVLHHLADPIAGWRILVDLLRPGGLMKIALYSEIARKDVVSGRALIAERGYSSSLEDIRRCRQDVIALAEGGNTDMRVLCQTLDFFSTSECRDLLFHVQESRFTLPEIEEALKTVNLRFLGFELTDLQRLTKFKETYPGKEALSSLARWHDFECEYPDTFRGMYQFLCRKE